LGAKTAACNVAGLDLDCGPFLAVHTEQAVTKGLLSEVDVNNALANTITVQMRLGMFDGEPSAHPFGDLGRGDVCTPAHQELALEAARQGIVLLKNQGSSLPLSTRRHRTVAVIGPNSAVTDTMIGNYAGVPCGYTTPLQGIGRYARIIRQDGCSGVACNDNRNFGAAEAAARQADATILVMGLDQSIEAESRDRVGLLLPGHQQELVSRVAKASKGPTVLVLMSGGPVDVSFAKNDPRISAILWAGYPGQAGGAAIADVLFGTTNPGNLYYCTKFGLIDKMANALVVFVVLTRRKTAYDMVPAGVPSEGADDKHGHAGKPIRRLPWSNIPVLQGPCSVPFWSRAELHKILPQISPRFERGFITPYQPPWLDKLDGCASQVH
jgi:hypothetical protein